MIRMQDLNYNLEHYFVLPVWKTTLYSHSLITVIYYFILYLGLMTDPLNFRNDLDYDPDAEPGLRSFISAKVCSL